MPIRLPRLASAILVAGLAVGSATPAFAQERTTDEPRADLETVAARCIEQIDRRLGDLATAQSRAANVDALTEAHLAAINSIIDSTEAGLADLATQIRAAEERVELAELCAAIATDHRVYLVVIPQTHLAVGADRVDAAAERGLELIATFDAAVDAAVEAGADVTDAVALRDAAAGHVAAAEAAVVGVGDTVLTVTPASWNDGPGQTVIQDSRAAVRSGHDEINQGIADGKAAIEALRVAIGAVTDA